MNWEKQNKLDSKCSLGSGWRSPQCHTKELKYIENLLMIFQQRNILIKIPFSETIFFIDYSALVHTFLSCFGQQQ